jgi:predicted MFS family arabinose efflux permease
MGSGCILGAFLSGYLSDKLRMKNVGKLSIGLIFIVSAGTAIVNKYMRKDVAFICAVFWGITR